MNTTYKTASLVLLATTLCLTGCKKEVKVEAVINKGKIVDGTDELAEIGEYDLAKTVAYVDNPRKNGVIELYGNGTGKSLDIKKCQTGLCFTHEYPIEEVMYAYTTLHSNKCNDEFAVTNLIKIALNEQGVSDTYKKLEGKIYHQSP